MAPWHHAPLHVLLERGVYMMTAGTHLKVQHFRSAERLALLHDKIHDVCSEFGWELHAWAVLSNHYHFVAQSPENPVSLRKLISKVHTLTATAVNKLDGTPGRKIWHQFWDTRLTFETSYLARLNYVQQNAVHHGIVTDATSYRWCSAAQFECEADPSFQRTVRSMPIDELSVPDDF